MSSDPRFSAFLKERIGLDVASVGEAIIERAVRQRCQSSQAPSAEAYWQHLQNSHDEQQALIFAADGERKQALKDLPAQAAGR